MTGAPRSKVIAAFAAVYLLWGSTYLFIKYAVAFIPPLGMAGARFLIAGVLLYAYGRWRGAERPRALHWRSAGLVGVMLMTSNAGVAWSERRIPSGVASLLVAITPCWMVLFDWLGHRDRRPNAGVILGLLAGLAGVAILIGPGDLMGGGGGIDPAGALSIIGGTAVWAAGSLYARKAPRPTSPQLLSGMQMICGGGALTVVSALTGQWDGYSIAETPAIAWWSFLYLLTFGSLIAFSAYMYLLTVSTPARVSTYAYVNPVVAVLLGWAFAGEVLTPRMMVASAVIVGAVALIVSFGASGPPQQAALKTDEFPVASTDAA
ncbi:MAG TPA: EamA family transporter [Gemmatimonadaceae bacterium]|nr:EamA family transporter [Gemmatimonadaceae bacterium]HPV73975.1 EamA family transporter [Gemmatimonadaceae bacterium]